MSKMETIAILGTFSSIVLALLVLGHIRLTVYVIRGIVRGVSEGDGMIVGTELLTDDHKAYRLSGDANGSGPGIDMIGKAVEVRGRFRREGAVTYLVVERCEEMEAPLEESLEESPPGDSVGAPRRRAA
jgi:hypothetical protein